MTGAWKAPLLNFYALNFYALNFYALKFYALKFYALKFDVWIHWHSFIEKATAPP